MTLQLEQSLDREHSEKHFQRDIDAITSRQLSPENIDSYAEDALEDLVSVVEDAVASYHDNPTQDFETNKQREIAALRYFGLDADTVEQQLDHIANVADEIRELDTVIGEITHRSNDVIVPPNPDGARIIPGDGSFEKKQVMPRLKTLLFVLSNDFGVDLRDEQQLRVTTGTLRDSMMRGESYNFVETPALGRTVLVCDEEGNVTYVFNDEALREASIATTDIDGLSKTDLNDLIENEPALGHRIKYTTRYVPNLIASLGQDETNESGQYLQKVIPPPEGYVSLSGFAKQLEIDAGAIKGVVVELEPELGEVPLYKFKYGAPTRAYSPAQQRVIREALERRGTLSRVPDDYLPLYGLANAMGVERATVTRAINELGEALGESVRGRKKGAGAVASPHYSPVQQDMIRDHLEKGGSFSGPPPEGFLPIFGMVKAWDSDHGAVQRAIDALGSELGEATRAKARTTVANFYSPKQQEMIHAYLESKGSFAGSPPDGYLSKPDIQELFGGVSERVITRALESLGADIGEVVMAKLDKKHPPQSYYSPNQVSAIHAWVLKNGRNRKNGKFIRDLFSER